MRFPLVELLPLLACGLLTSCSTAKPRQTTSPFFVAAIKEGGVAAKELGSGARQISPPAKLSLEVGQTNWVTWWIVSRGDFRKHLAGSAGPGLLTALPAVDETGWDTVHQVWAAKAKSVTLHGAVQDDLFWLEPATLYGWMEAAADAAPISASVQATAAGENVKPRVRLREPANTLWPVGAAPNWHQQDEFSGLAAAREIVRKGNGTQLWVRVAHLDTGYSPRHLACPTNVSRAFEADCYLEDVGPCQTGSAEDRLEGWLATFKKMGHPFTQKGHGNGTLSILAGREVELVGNDGQPIGIFELGGAPDVEVLPIRVSQSVIHFDPWRIGAALFYAAGQHADVANICMGGPPTPFLESAIVNAYEHGLAVISATGDFVSMPGLLRLVVPAAPKTLPGRRSYYPASHPRVLAVAGITAKDTSYGEAPPSVRGFLNALFCPQLRGSYGPAGMMDRAVSAYAPNIPWAAYETPDELDRVDLDGGGVSSATPQVTSAAALWLQYYRTNATLAAHWTGWRKTEMVYQALLQSARTTNRLTGRPLDREHFGRGVLNAPAALRITPEQLSQHLEPAPASGGESSVDFFVSLVREYFADRVPGGQSAQLRAFVQEIIGSAHVDENIADALHGLVAAPSQAGARENLARAIRNSTAVSDHLHAAMQR